VVLKLRSLRKRGKKITRNRKKIVEGFVIFLNVCPNHPESCNTRLIPLQHALLNGIYLLHV
jgi:hypothetical protein